MIIRRKQKCEARTFQRLEYFGRLQAIAHAELMKQIRASALRGGCAIAMLGNRNSASGKHKCSHGGNVEGAFLVAAGSARVHRFFKGQMEWNSACKHCA